MMHPLRRLLSMLLVLALPLSAGWGAMHYFMQVKPAQDCEQVKEKYPLTDLPEWQVQCVRKLPANKWSASGQDPTILGLTDSSTKTIYLRVGGGYLADTLAHEEGHAYAFTYFTPALEKQFTEDVGGENYLNDSYDVNPAEQWARGWAVCKGFKNSGSYQVYPSCSLIDKYLKLTNHPRTTSRKDH